MIAGDRPAHALVATARRAGALYLVSGLLGAMSYLYVPSAVIVPGDAGATARRIAEGALLYRLGIASDLLSSILLVLLALTLYGLLRDADRGQARLMVALVAVGAAAQVANVLNLMAPLILLGGAPFLAVFDRPQLEALALGFLRLRSSGLFVSQVFWGLWLFPLGLLVLRSGYFPRILGHLLIVACAAYVTATLTFLVWPAFTPQVNRLMQPLEGLGEGAIMLWLLVKGVRVPAKVPA